MENYKYPSSAMETAFEYKYQMATETVEQNTSKQFSAKETNYTPECVQVLKERFFFFFLNWSDFEGNGVEEVK